LRAGLVVAARTKWDARTDYLLANLGGVELELGHWDEARDLLEQALQLSEAADNVQHVWSLLRMGELLRRQGRMGAAAQMLEELLPACEKWEDSCSLGACLRSLALVRLASGDLAGAVTAMDYCIQHWQSQGVVLFYDQALWSGIELYLQVGQVDRARELLEALASIAGRVATPAEGAYLADAQGMLAAHECRHTEAAVHFKHATERWHDMEFPYQQACTRKHRAESLLQTGDATLRAEAEQDLASVRTIFLRLGLSETAVTIDSAELR
jgi:tetratricopeptide (TPR) repeat protein